ncbi:MAG: hypothetical protein AAB737_03200 [Patescibacteria group bacterium]
MLTKWYFKEMNEGDHDPYEAYLEKYYQVRQGIQASADEVEDVLFEAMGTQHREISPPLQAIYDFVRRALEERASLSWVLRAEAHVQEALEYRERIATMGKEVSAKVILQAEKGKGLGKNSGVIRERIAQGIVGSILHTMDPKTASLLSADHFSTITVDIMSMRNNECTASLSGSWRDPASGQKIPIVGTATIEMGHLTKRGGGQ